MAYLVVEARFEELFDEEVFGALEVAEAVELASQGEEDASDAAHVAK